MCPSPAGEYLSFFLFFFGYNLFGLSLYHYINKHMFFLFDMKLVADIICLLIVLVVEDMLVQYAGSL